MEKEESGKPVSRSESPLCPKTTCTSRFPAYGSYRESPVPKDDVISRFQKRRMKIGSAKAALEAGLTMEEVCGILQGENQEAMRIAVEAWDKLLQVRPALIAMRGNLNSRDLEQIIKDIGTIVSPFPEVKTLNDE